MFGFSITKLLFTVAVIALVWYGFKWVGRMQVKREHDARERLRREAAGPAHPGAGDAEEMVRCAACGAFVAASGAKNCGREDCPYPG
ncbi:MAG: hypothetical protein ACE5GT_05610 [Rhodospirillales bacterium]